MTQERVSRSTVIAQLQEQIQRHSNAIAILKLGPNEHQLDTRRRKLRKCKAALRYIKSKK